MLKLTGYERVALGSRFNLSDGHPRHRPFPTQERIIGNLPELFWESRVRRPYEVEREAHAAFFSALGQYRAYQDELPVLSFYSASVAMDTLARALQARTKGISLIHPTFDNIADLLRSRGHRLFAIEEDALSSGGNVFANGSADCVFITSPNNPTGWILSRERLRSVCMEAQDRGAIVVLDCSLRGLDPRAMFDHYSVLLSSGVEFVVIEDSGKLWPTQELKVGFLVDGAPSLNLENFASDVLLCVSPLTLLLITKFADDYGDCGRGQLHSLVQERRSTLRAALAPIGFVAADPNSLCSVERLRLPPGLTADECHRRLSLSGVEVLPCRPFFWSSPSMGRDFIRVALARESSVFDDALGIMRSAFA